MATILVKSALPEGKVALWERHPEHPGGEVFVAGDSVVEVEETPAVLRALAERRIVQVQSAAKRGKL